MICIIEMDKGAPTINPRPIKWLIAVDIDDARRQAQSAGDIDLAQYLYQSSYLNPGRYMIPPYFDGGQRFILVS